MKAFGEIAAQATELVQNGDFNSPLQAWEEAVRVAFPQSHSLQNKACPRGAYLGLCEEGMVAGVPRGTYTRSKDNKQYAVRAAQLLQHNPGLATAGPEQLWDRVMEGNSKAHNSQMDVVLTLWQRGLLTPSSHDA